MRISDWSSDVCSSDLRIVLLPSFSPENWLTQCASAQVTNAFVVPTMLTRIIAHIEETQAHPELPALRALAYGGGKMPVQVIDRALALFPRVAFTNAYGLTETSRSEEHTSELQSLMRISYAVFCLKKKEKK